MAEEMGSWNAVPSSMERLERIFAGELGLRIDPHHMCGLEEK